MKHLLLSVFIIASILGLAAQDTVQQARQDIVEKEQPAITNPQSVAEQAQYEYQEKNYRKAIEILENEIKVQSEQGNVSSQLYYNLGNAYFRVDEFPEAILNYERAHLYDPGDRDTRHNIEYAMTKIEDKILTADNFFLQIWFEGIQNLLPSDRWATISIVMFVLLMASLFLFFFSPVLKLKKVGFYTGIVLFICIIFTNIFAINQKRKIQNRDTAIVMAGSAPVVSSPSGASKELFILHAGTKVEINKSDGGWYEIEIANGSIGWIQKEMIEII
ncbi:tetratricopeptide repeat protein [Dysgonomonas sp. OttesenSCG-928-M03]|nr:tetratricopeptide repeat protein [Dysgonomonas sp. OttesenSCG-928-M03]